jgi:hypothetical protein
MTGSIMYVPDSHLVQDEDEPEQTGRSASTAGADQLGHDENPTPVQTSHVVITTTKVSHLREEKEFLRNTEMKAVLSPVNHTYMGSICVLDSDPSVKNSAFNSWVSGMCGEWDALVT